MRAPRLSHLAFAATMIAVGIIGLIQRDFTPTWTGVPDHLPGRGILVYLCAIASLVSGLGLMWKRSALTASRGLLIYLALWLLLFRLSHVLRAPASVDAWWGSADTSVMVAAAWVLCLWFAAGRQHQGRRFMTSERGLRIARVLYGLALIPFGIAHFVYLDRTAPIVPKWLPWHVAWAYATGGAFIVAGLAIITGKVARLAATLSMLQMAGFTVLVWVPIVVAGPNPFQWSEFVDSWVLTAAALVVADSYRAFDSTEPAPT